MYTLQYELQCHLACMILGIIITIIISRYHINNKPLLIQQHSFNSIQSNFSTCHKSCCWLREPTILFFFISYTFLYLPDSSNSDSMILILKSVFCPTTQLIVHFLHLDVQCTRSFASRLLQIILYHLSSSGVCILRGDGSLDQYAATCSLQFCCSCCLWITPTRTISFAWNDTFPLIRHYYMLSNCSANYVYSQMFAEEWHFSHN